MAPDRKKIGITRKFMISWKGLHVVEQRRRSTVPMALNSMRDQVAMTARAAGNIAPIRAGESRRATEITTSTIMPWTDGCGGAAQHAAPP